jgi:hypothetical protein
MTKWTDALKIWNKDKPNWSIPKKGTKGYDEVRAIMNNLGSSTPKQNGDKQDGGVVNLIKELGGILSKNPLVKKYVKNTAPIMKEIAQIKLSKLSKKAKEANIGPLLDVIEKEGKKRVYAPVNKLLKGQMGKGHKQTGGLIGTLAMIVAPFVIEGIINVAKKKPFFGDGLRQLGTGDESSNELLQMYQEELTGGNLFEDIIFGLNPSAGVARNFTKKELEKMKGGDLFEDIVYAFNPSANVARLQLNKELKKTKGVQLKKKTKKMKGGNIFKMLDDLSKKEGRKGLEADLKDAYKSGWRPTDLYGGSVGYNEGIKRLNNKYKLKKGETLIKAVEKERQMKGGVYFSENLGSRLGDIKKLIREKNLD